MAASNEEVAEVLEAIAEAMRITGENRFKANAYEQAADAVRAYEPSIFTAYSRNGERALTGIEGIGEGISRVVAEYLETGRSRLLDDLRAQTSPEKLFADIPGIGDELAGRIVASGISSLEELEQAAHSGALQKIEGIGRDRAQLVRDHLGRRLQPAARAPSGTGDATVGPADDLLLEVDREYREKAERGELRTIAPRRFNPEHESWLPILETERDGWSFSALYSNTARAHKEGKTRDWVVIYFEKRGQKGQRTVVTADRGPRKGQRVVAG
ncbi:MAG: helix-hairpin-helix domain-containing protein [Spirochaetota bacterium]